MDTEYSMGRSALENNKRNLRCISEFIQKGNPSDKRFGFLSDCCTYTTASCATVNCFCIDKNNVGNMI